MAHDIRIDSDKAFAAMERAEEPINLMIRCFTLVSELGKVEGSKIPANIKEMLSATSKITDTWSEIKKVWDDTTVELKGIVKAMEEENEAFHW